MKRIVIFIFILCIMFFYGVCAKELLAFKPQNIKVYIQPKDMLSVTMKHAFMDWQKHLNNNMTFVYVGTKSTANIEVIFVEQDIAKICQKNALGCNKKIIAATRHGNQKCIDSKIYISMRDNQNKLMSSNQVYTVMLHEVGHALGLNHSQDKNSIMYEGTNRNMAEKQEIQPEDIQNLYKMYGIEE